MCWRLQWRWGGGDQRADRGVNIALGAADISECRSLDNGQGTVTVDQLIAGKQCLVRLRAVSHARPGHRHPDRHRWVGDAYCDPNLR